MPSPTDLPDLLDLLGELADTAALPRVRIVAKRPLEGRWVPRAFSLLGVEGRTTSVAVRSQAAFKPVEFFAQDTSACFGRATTIVSWFIGNLSLLRGGDAQVNIPTWAFYEWLAPEDREAAEVIGRLIGTPYETPAVQQVAAKLRIAEAAMKASWEAWPAGINCTIQIRFDKTCRWDGVFWGWEI